MTNAIATPQQFAAERDVAAMWETDVVKRARATVGYSFAMAHGIDVPEDERETFDAAMDEYVTNYLFKAAASDGAHPRFVRDFMPAYAWDGRQVHGARMGGDNPDNIYQLAGITHGGRYRVTGTPTGKPPAQISLTLTGNYGTSVTIQTLESHELQCDADGGFVLTIDDRPADGRPNHLTTAPHVKFLFVRQSLEDWATECGYALAIERIDPVDTPPLTVGQMAEQGAFRAAEEVPLYFWFHRLFSGLPVNTLRPPLISASVGGLVTQAGVQGWFQLDADDVVLIRYQPAGAAYVALELTDWWFRSLEADRRTSSLTRAQSVADEDGWITVVLARRDPGVMNWLDAGDRERVLFLGRWQGLPSQVIAGGPQIETTLMKRDALPMALLDRQTITAEGRQRQIDDRVAAWNRRITV